MRYDKGRMVELAMPEKKTVELDARLAGELKDNAVNVNVGLALVNERLANISLPIGLADLCSLSSLPS